MDLEDNALSCWAELLRLQRLPALAKLHLTNNPLSSITYPAPAPAAPAPAPPTAPAPAQPPQPASVSQQQQQRSNGSPAEANSGGGAEAGTGALDGGAAPFARLTTLYLGGCALGGAEQRSRVWGFRAEGGFAGAAAAAAGAGVRHGAAAWKRAAAPHPTPTPVNFEP